MTALEQLEALPQSERFLVMGFLDIVFFCDTPTGPDTILVARQAPPKLITALENIRNNVYRELPPLPEPQKGAPVVEYLKLKSVYDARSARVSLYAKALSTARTLYEKVLEHRAERVSDAAFLRALKARQFKIEGPLDDIMCGLYTEMCLCGEQALEEKLSQLRVSAAGLLAMLNLRNTI